MPVKEGFDGARIFVVRYAAVMYMEDLRKARLGKLPALLLPWYDRCARPLPWRGERDPYRIWISETMLQQTRAETVKGYYARFLQALPDVQALAEAEEERLLKLWEGLGYYSRARNLQKAARQICRERAGQFPQACEELKALPGIGPYTAGAVASIAFEQPAPAVDGNVVRLLSRYLCDETPKDKLGETLRRELEEIYPPGRCGDFTQALMEAGATVCGPAGAPRCEDCPLKKDCLARENGRQKELPVCGKKAAHRTEARTVFLLRAGDALALRKRPGKGLLAGMWEFPNVTGELEASQALEQAARWGCGPWGEVAVRQERHVFTHVTWEMTGYEIHCAQAPAEFVWATQEEMKTRYSLPTAFRRFLPANEK